MRAFRHALALLVPALLSPLRREEATWMEIVNSSQMYTHASESRRGTSITTRQACRSPNELRRRAIKSNPNH